MRFRARIFLAIVLPASFLVAAAVVAALLETRRQAQRAAQGEFERTQKAVQVILKERQRDLADLEKVFVAPWFREFVEKAVQPEARDGLRKHLAYQLEELQLRIDYFAAAGPDGKVWIRINETHACAPECRHEDENAWIVNRREAVFRAGGDPFLGRSIVFSQEGGALVLGRNLKEDLRRICDSLKVEMSLESGGVEVWRSLAAWDPSREGEGDVEVGGAHYLAGRSPLGAMAEITLVMMRNMEEVDAERRKVAVFGMLGIALSILIAALASLRIAGGVSRPVEALTGAVQKVATGDFSVQVEAAGQDEIGRLGAAFNEMTVGLRKRQDILEKTLSRDVAEEFLKGGTERGGERRVITIVFMDIRGYTSGTEGMDPADVVIMLNELMDLLDGAIERHGGSVNKFLGDGLMAMFGTPKPLENHALRAVEAAIEMQKQMERWNHRRIARGLNSFYSGIGINTGQAVCGKVGGRNRMEYTLIGEEVNLTSRICGKAAPRQVLITKQTYELVKDKIQVNPMEPVVVKGLSYPIKIYEVVS